MMLALYTYTDYARLCSAAFQELHGEEYLRLSMEAEDSVFMRCSGSRVRQMGSVQQQRLEMKLVAQKRQAMAVLDLCGELATDRNRVLASLRMLRRDLQQLPEDPLVVIGRSMASSFVEHEASLPSLNNLSDLILSPARGQDLTGLFTQGRIGRALQTSAGADHWFVRSDYLMDYSLIAGDRMVKDELYGSHWDAATYRNRLKQRKQELMELKKLPELRLKPGVYPVYLAPPAVAELLALSGWGGFSEGALRRGQCALQKLHEGQTRLSPAVHLSDDPIGLGVPAFTDDGDIM